MTRCIKYLNPISKARLLVLPDTCYCVRCSPVTKITEQTLSMENLDASSPTTDDTIPIQQGKLPSIEGISGFERGISD